MSIEKRSLVRNNYIDVLKGLGIVMVIMGHCLSYTDNPLNKMILSFHMPLFYLISGLTIKRIKSVTEFRAFVKRKLINIGIPMLWGGVFNLICDLIWLRIDGFSLDGFDYYKYFDNWFLEALLISVVIVTIIVSELNLMIKSVFSVIYIFFIVSGNIIGNLYGIKSKQTIVATFFAYVVILLIINLGG